MADPIYVDVPAPLDPDDLVQGEYDQLSALIPGWEPQDGQLEVWLLMACARITFQAWTVAQEVPAAIFRYFGAKIVGLPPTDAVAAHIETNWVMVDDAGYTIPVGAQVGLPDGTGGYVAFEMTYSITIPPGATSTLDIAQEPHLPAVVPGSDGNGLSGPPVLLDDLAFVDHIELAAPSFGGVDAETDDAYLDRLTVEFRLFGRHAVLPEDYVLFARTVPGVDRALALDLYQPGAPYGPGPASNVEGAITVAVVGPDGLDPGATVRGQVLALLEANSVTNSLSYVIPATYTAITVTFTAVALPGFDPADVHTSAVQAVKDFLDPANWGQPLYGEDRSWIDTTTVYHNDIVWAIRNTEGVAHVTAVTVNGSSTADVTLTGPAGMPAANPTVTGTVT